MNIIYLSPLQRYLPIFRRSKSRAAARTQRRGLGNSCLEGDEVLQRKSHRLERVQCLSNRDWGAGQLGTGQRFL